MERPLLLCILRARTLARVATSYSRVLASSIFFWFRHITATFFTPKNMEKKSHSTSCCADAQSRSDGACAPLRPPGFDGEASRRSKWMCQGCVKACFSQTEGAVQQNLVWNVTERPYKNSQDPQSPLVCPGKQGALIKYRSRVRLKQKQKEINLICRCNLVPTSR